MPPSNAEPSLINMQHIKPIMCIEYIGYSHSPWGTIVKVINLYTTTIINHEPCYKMLKPYTMCVM